MLSALPAAQIMSEYAAFNSYIQETQPAPEIPSVHQNLKFQEHPTPTPPAQRVAAAPTSDPGMFYDIYIHPINTQSVPRSPVGTKKSVLSFDYSRSADVEEGHFRVDSFCLPLEKHGSARGRGVRITAYDRLEVGKRGQDHSLFVTTAEHRERGFVSCQPFGRWWKDGRTHHFGHSMFDRGCITSILFVSYCSTPSGSNKHESGTNERRIRFQVLRHSRRFPVHPHAPPNQLPFPSFAS